MTPVSQLRYDLQPDETLVLVHIPKTGGRTLRHRLILEYAPHQVYVGNQFDINNLADAYAHLNKHHLVMGHFGYQIRPIIDKPVMMTLLRDPIERLLSVYSHAQHTQTDPSIIHELAAKHSFDDFIRHPSAELRPHIANTMTRFICGLDNFDTALPKDILKNARQNLRVMPFVGILERVEDSMMLMSYTFDWPYYGTDRVKLNVSPQRIRQVDLSTETLQLAHEINDLDIQLYRFAAEMFRKRFEQMGRELARDSQTPAEVEVQPEQAQQEPDRQPDA